MTTAGQRHDSLAFEHLMNNMSVLRPGRGRPRRRPDELLADKAYSSKAIRGHLRSRGIRATIPLKSDQQAGRRGRGARGRLPGFDANSYKQRNVVERAVNKLRLTLRWPPATTNATSSTAALSTSPRSGSGYATLS